jgi:hypothetical protein
MRHPEKRIIAKAPETGATSTPIGIDREDPCDKTPVPRAAEW